MKDRYSRVRIILEDDFEKLQIDAQEFKLNSFKI